MRQMIQTGEGRNQPTTTFSLAVQPDLVGATQSVETCFASTHNKQRAPLRRGAREQNPQNYYISYRHQLDPEGHLAPGRKPRRLAVNGSAGPLPTAAFEVT